MCQVGGCGIEASWAGGVDGREVRLFGGGVGGRNREIILFDCIFVHQITDVFLKCVPSILSPHGVLYLVLIKENKPGEMADS